MDQQQTPTAPQDMTREELEAEVTELRDRVASMRRDVDLLAALEAAGVDGWDGYDEAREALDD
ncbi:hypothetical protein [Streptomyces sp. WMMC897]|uniref:hypothetical protein n=1 Tax=Streptomyces sp. WMMC897 TaxID=3014782 RepID=UPI0022B717CE|nr:hypothetical protein [Streptomyces sp. WMMC897]MCZ7413063.1 hypothetical protein [Streptomyces sp. WMMC897]MCZ7415465.1 hypothetical protein [Streptomyces sp. WMMC897]